MNGRWYAVHMRKEPWVMIVEEMIDPSLEEMQEAVKGESPRGMIESVPNKLGWELYCHEEGMMWGLPRNTLFATMVGWDDMDSVFWMDMFPVLGTIILKDNYALRTWKDGELYDELVKIAAYGKTQCKVCGSGMDAHEDESMTCRYCSKEEEE